MTSKQLQLAIFALDSHNRGYGAGLSSNALADTAGKAFAESQILVSSRSNSDSPEVAAGFYAAA